MGCYRFHRPGIGLPAAHRNGAHNGLVVTVIDVVAAWILGLGHDTPLCGRTNHPCTVCRCNKAIRRGSPARFRGGVSWLRDAARVISGKALL